LPCGDLSVRVTDRQTLPSGRTKRPREIARQRGGALRSADRRAAPVAPNRPRAPGRRERDLRRDSDAADSARASGSPDDCQRSTAGSRCFATGSPSRAAISTAPCPLIAAAFAACQCGRRVPPPLPRLLSARSAFSVAGAPRFLAWLSFVMGSATVAQPSAIGDRVGEADRRLMQLPSASPCAERLQGRRVFNVRISGLVPHRRSHQIVRKVPHRNCRRRRN